MKWIVLILLLFVSCSRAPQKTGSEPPTIDAVQQRSEPGRVSFANGKVSFIPPHDFERMTQEQIDLKFPKGNGERFLFANEKMSVSCGVTFSPARIPPDQPEKIVEAFEKLLPRMIPGLIWQTREVVEINGVKWAHFRFIANAVDTEIQNDMFVTSFESKALIFAFNSTVSEYESVKTILENSKNTIKVEP
jgi:hypothetical protein